MKNCSWDETVIVKIYILAKIVLSLLPSIHRQFLYQTCTISRLSDLPKLRLVNPCQAIEDLKNLDEIPHLPSLLQRHQSQQFTPLL